MAKGSCVCGTARYEVTSLFNDMMSCHCSMCRKHHGSAFATYVSAPAEDFRFLAGEDALLVYPSSENGVRVSCKHCGSALPTIRTKHGRVMLPAGPLDDIGVKPQGHLYVGSKAPWYEITDSLPQHAEYPPEYTIRGVTRPKIEPREGVTEGSCLCGAAAFEVHGPALSMQSCHCQRCRRARGAAHGTNIFYKLDQLRWTRGEEMRSEYKLPEARVLTTSFCRQCGGALPRLIRHLNLAAIPAGCLDTDPGMRPQRHVFTNYKAPWFEITDGLPQFGEGPPSPSGR
jgi:hypothetical protein